MFRRRRRRHVWYESETVDNPADMLPTDHVPCLLGQEDILLAEQQVGVHDCYQGVCGWVRLPRSSVTTQVIKKEKSSNY